MADSFRLYFLIVCAIALAVGVVEIVIGTFRLTPAERRPEGAGRYLLAILTPLLLIVPPAAILSRAGEIRAEWVGVRSLGVLLTLYTGGMEVWTFVTLRRFLVPRAVVFPDHQLVTWGPYRFLRHPDYSAILALWLGYALGTLNMYLLILFPIVVVGFSMEARVEEQLLESSFAQVYRDYARGKRRFVPHVRTP